MKTVKLPLIPIAKKWHAAILGFLIFIIAYTLLGNFHLVTPTYLPLTFIDRQIPLLPWTILIYISDYVFIFFVILNLKDARAISLLSYRTIVVSTVSFSVFFLFPTIYPRSELNSTALWSYLFRSMHFIDAPTNCLPSLHVSLTLLGAWSLNSFHGWKKHAIYFWAATICISTLTTKQHYVIDVAAGIAVVIMAMWLSRYIEISEVSIKEKHVSYKEKRKAS
ncbi:MAG: phosphatase PAP2 family protein [Oligoflexus sp.]